MLKILLTNKIRFCVALLLILLLVSVRAYENSLFYDPFLSYFKGDFNVMPLPKYDLLPFLMGLLFRYGLNSVLSLGLIYVLFKDLLMIKFASFLYLFFFVALIVLFFSIIYYSGSHNNWLLFYVRRFLIQPILVLLFIPAFYYQKVNK
jgi:exosortase F-associated protein